MSENLSTASESNPEVMSEGDKVRAYSTCYTRNSGGDSVAKVPLGCRVPNRLCCGPQGWWTARWCVPGTVYPNPANGDPAWAGKRADPQLSRGRPHLTRVEKVEMRQMSFLQGWCHRPSSFLKGPTSIILFKRNNKKNHINNSKHSHVPGAVLRAIRAEPI